MLFYTPSPCTTSISIGIYYSVFGMQSDNESWWSVGKYAFIFSVLCPCNEICTETLPSLTPSDVAEQSAGIPISINI